MRSAEVSAPVRVFISYAHDDGEHERRVRDLWVLLRTNGIDARLDLPAADRPQNWADWMLAEMRAAAFTLVVASPAYRRRAEGEEPAGVGRGVRWEAHLVKQAYYADPDAAVVRFLPVVLPGCSHADIPIWMGRETNTHYLVHEFTLAGAESLIRYLTSQPAVVVPPLGTVPVLARDGGITPGRPAVWRRSPARAGLRTRVLVQAQLSGEGVLSVATSVAGTPVGRHQAALPGEVRHVWAALRLGAGPASERLATAGQKLAGALFDEESARVVAGLVDRLPPGDGVDIVLCGDGPVVGLPLELLRLPTVGGRDGGPLCLRPGVTLARQVTTAPSGACGTLPGPLKILAAVSAPEETRTSSVPLDVEAEMQAVLDAVAPGPGGPAGRGAESAGAGGVDPAQVRILARVSAQRFRPLLLGSGELEAEGSVAPPGDGGGGG
jgi:hypothetical protein